MVMQMGDLFYKRMECIGNTPGEAIRTRSDELMDKTFCNDPEWRNCKLYDRYMQVWDDNVDLKFQFSQKYTINKDQVEYLVQFRPGYHPEIIYMDNDDIERLGFYLDILDHNTGKVNKWLIVGKDDKESFTRYNVLKCNWLFKWIDKGVVYSTLGILRNRNNYNSGVWSDGFVTSVENQAQFIVPANNKTFTIDYDMRFMLSDNHIKPEVYQVSKRENTFPPGVLKITLVQTHFDAARDNIEEKVCNYYNSPVLPDEDIVKPETVICTLNCSGTGRTLYMGGSSRTITASFTGQNHSTETLANWSFEFDGSAYTKEELAQYFNIDVNGNTVSVKAMVNSLTLGKTLRVIASDDVLKYKESIGLEVKR